MTDIDLTAIQFPSYVIEVGVLSMTTKRKETVKLGLTNAELMFIHENGSPLQHIPARPVLAMTLAWSRESDLVVKTIGKCAAILIATGDVSLVDKEMNKMCLKLQNYARKIIYANDGRLAPNSPSVARAKGGNHPLFNTGQLARSLTCRAIRIS